MRPLLFFPHLSSITALTPPVFSLFPDSPHVSGASALQFYFPFPSLKSQAHLLPRVLPNPPSISPAPMRGNYLSTVGEKNGSAQQMSCWDNHIPEMDQFVCWKSFVSVFFLGGFSRWEAHYSPAAKDTIIWIVYLSD